MTRDDAALRAALLETLSLKALPRAGWLRVGVEAPESVAAHSWGVAWLVLALCPPELDRGRALAIAVVHDLAEVRVGDITPHDGVSKAEKARREAEAFRDIADRMPQPEELWALWREYEERSTPEGRFVKACDKLDLALQAARYLPSASGARELLAAATAALDGHSLRALVPDA